MIASLNAFQDADVVMTIADGGTTFTLTRESLRGPIPESARLRRIQASVPEWWSICMQAARTPVVLSVWDDQQRCLPWDETVEWAEMLDLAVPDVVYRGIWEEKKNRLYLQDTVVRRTTGFGQREWRTQVAQCRISKP